MGTRDTDGRELLHLDEIAEYLKVRKDTVSKFIKKGVLEGVKMGRRSYATKESVEQYKLVQKVSLQELAQRVLILERRLDFILTQVNSEQKSKDSHLSERMALQGEMMKRFPGLKPH